MMIVIQVVHVFWFIHLWNDWDDLYFFFSPFVNNISKVMIRKRVIYGFIVMHFYIKRKFWSVFFKTHKITVIKVNEMRFCRFLILSMTLRFFFYFFLSKELLDDIHFPWCWSINMFFMMFIVILSIYLFFFSIDNAGNCLLDELWFILWWSHILLSFFSC